MNRLFGSTSSAKPKPTLQDAITATDGRIDGIQVKVKKLDGELTRYRDQLKRMKGGPGKVRSLLCTSLSACVRLTCSSRFYDHHYPSRLQSRSVHCVSSSRRRSESQQQAWIGTVLIECSLISYESQMEQLQQQTFNMEQASMTTENLRNTMATVDAMKTANKEMKKQYGKLDVDKIESLHYEMEDLMEAANEVQESMSRTYGVPEELDEADLQAGESTLTLLESICFNFSSDCWLYTELDALEDELAFESVSGNDEAIPSYLRDDIHEPLPDLVDDKPVEVSCLSANRPTKII